jgi:hypothetical protein
VKVILPFVERIESVAQPTIKEEFFNGIGSELPFAATFAKDRCAEMLLKKSLFDGSGNDGQALSARLFTPGLL